MAAVKARRFQPFIARTDTVLDFGCASGEVLMAIPCARRIGVEVNPAFLSRARAKGIEAYASLADVPGNSVDVAISGHVLEHCLRPLDELLGIRRVLREGGRLVLVLPLDDWRAQRRFDALDLNHHLYAWTPLLLGNLLSEAGFEVEHVGVSTHAWPPRGAYQLWRLLPHWLFDGLCVISSVLLRRRQVHAIARAGRHSH
jgi:SAM-dependent methyltransferase